MKKLRIGEALLEKGLITPEQLSMALRDQEILGGHLGTCLIELGFVSEEALGQTLGELQNMRYASWADLSAAPEDAIDSVPRDLVEKYRVVPILLEDRTLHVATVAPRTLSALSTATGKRIVPWVAPEIRILQAMEMHYSIPLQPRYIKLRNQLDAGGRQIALADEPGKSDGENSCPGDAATTVVDDTPWLSAPDGEDAGGAADFGYGKSWREIAESIDDSPNASPGEVPAPPRPATATTAAAGPGPTPDRLAGERRETSPGPTPATAETPIATPAGAVRQERRTLPVLAHAASLLRIRYGIDRELQRLGFPAGPDLFDELAIWVASRILRLEPVRGKRGLGRDPNGDTFRIVRARNVPGSGPVLEFPLTPRVDFVVGVRTNAEFAVETVFRARFDSLLRFGASAGDEARVAWSEIDMEHDGIDAIYPRPSRPAPVVAPAAAAPDKG